MNQNNSKFRKKIDREITQEVKMIEGISNTNNSSESLQSSAIGSAQEQQDQFSEAC